MDFTSAQLEAITCRGGSVLVSAGAGSGKTRVLTERLMEYMDPRYTDAKPENIDRFLVITFTRAAAGELRARIADTIADRLREDPANAHLRRQILLCRNAQIGTIHSFCASILREYAGALGISPAFRILEEEKSERLRAAALERVLERRYESGEQDFLDLTDRVGAGRDDTRLSDLVLKLHANMQSHARPEDWARDQVAGLSAEPVDIGDTPWGRELLEDAAAEVSFWQNQMEEALSDMQTEEKILRAYETSFRTTLDALRTLSEKLEIGWDESARCFPLPFTPLSPIRNNPDPELSSALKASRDECKKAMEKLSLAFSGTTAQLLSDLKETAPEMQTLLSLTMELEEEFQQAKARSNALDFSDLEHLTIRLLTEEDGSPTDAAQEIASRFTEIMVDEYQDVSRVQDRIFHAVSREGGNLFFVGDLKQSIYRFRLADPEIFNEKNHLFSRNARGERVIHLQENFRSRKEVLDAVNTVFSHCMSERLGNLDYGPDDRLIPGLPPAENSSVPELLLVSREEAENTDMEAEASLVAGEILRLMNSCRVREGESDRPLRFGDIAILLRSANKVGGVFRRVLLNREIPVSAGAGGDFYDSIEVSTVFSMLSVMDNPHRDIPLVTLLSSPAFGFDADKLSLIRASRPDADYYTALCASEDADAKIFLSRLRKLRKEAPDLNAVSLIDRVIEELDLYALVSAMPDGEQRLHRLSDLVAMAETFQNSGEFGLHRFVSWLRNMEQKDRDPETCSDGGDAVHVLSIHRSKGLEFPVVFVSGLGRSFNRQDTRDVVLIHPELGLGPKRTDPERKVEYPTAARRAIERRLTREMLSEEMRLLYVAMTRAKDRLYLTACIRKADEKLSRADQLRSYTKIPAQLLESSSNAVQWLLPAALDNRTLRYRICVEGGAERGEEREEQAASGGFDRKLLEQLRCNLTAAYPYAAAEHLPSKLTATALKTPDPDAAPLLREYQLFRDLDLGEEQLSATRIGTATHLVLQQIDFAKTDSVPKIRQELDRLEKQRFLTREEADAVDPEQIRAFFASELGLRIRRAEKVWREFRFSLMTDARDLFPTEQIPAEDKILLQGVVDCFFQEDNTLVLVDYKTDRIRDEEALRVRSEHYRIQLETYANALERIFGLPVKEKQLYFLKHNRTVRL